MKLRGLKPEQLVTLQAYLDDMSCPGYAGKNSVPVGTIDSIYTFPPFARMVRPPRQENKGAMRPTYAVVLEVCEETYREVNNFRTIRKKLDELLDALQVFPKEPDTGDPLPY